MIINNYHPEHFRDPTTPLELLGYTLCAVLAGRVFETPQKQETKMKTIECINHKAERSRDVPFSGQIGDNVAACGNITEVETCACGAERRQNRNQHYVSGWTEWTDSSVEWWIKRNRAAIMDCCSDPDLAHEWVEAIISSAETGATRKELELVRSRVRSGEQITLYARA